MKTEYERAVAANAAVLKVLADGAEARLRSIPGVRHVCVGLRERAGKISRELCIRVYVNAKRPESELSARERIPREIGGIPTDVHTRRRADFSIDATRYRPLKGGMLISNAIVAVDEAGTGRTMEGGTFGCTATRRSNGKPVLLTNWHVIMANKAKKGDAIYNPVPLVYPQFPLNELPKRVGEKDDLIAHITDFKITDKVDCAIAELDVSSCCRCCGLDFRDEIIGLSDNGMPPTNQLHGMRAAVPNTRVFKVGITTGRTEGLVSTINAGPLTAHLEGNDYDFNGQIEISSGDPLAPFSLKGDSGSVIVDEEGFAVGLLFGSVRDVGSEATYANHMTEVCDALKIDLNLVRPPHGTAAYAEQRRVTFPIELSPTGAELYATTRARVESDISGRWLWALAEAHREEIVALVTENRRVSVAWQRAGGPAVFAAALNSLRAGDRETLPVPPQGTLETALAHVGTALATHGSDALRAALATNRDAILAAARGSRTLTEFLDKLRAHAIAQQVLAPEMEPA
jgi:hypothetical protein